MTGMKTANTNRLETAPAIVRIAIVDAPTLLLESLVVALALEPDFDVIWTAHQPADWYRKLESHKPHVMIVDFDASHGTWPMIQRVRRTDPEIGILILTHNASDAGVKQALDLGASGYLLKSEPLQAVVDALHAVID
ncbi:MAG: response regulator transcription factor, partial [Planctomycetaceae bacterium]